LTDREDIVLAVKLEFINLIMPIQRIRDLYPGGWEAFLGDNVKRIGRVLWSDLTLVRATGCMDSSEVDGLITRYSCLGFTATESIGGVPFWKDFCVLDAFGRSQYDCPWIMVDGAERVAWLREGDPGGVVGRENFR
jgi:hypothetical protein